MDTDAPGRGPQEHPRGRHDRRRPRRRDLPRARQRHPRRDPSLPGRSRRRREPDREGHGAARRRPRRCTSPSLERAGLLHTELRPASRGLQKVCARTYDELVFDLPRGPPIARDAVDVEMPIGGFSDFVVEPTCGLVSATGLIGFMDDPSAFYEPDRLTAQLLWFRVGVRRIPVPESRPTGCPSRVAAVDRRDLQRSPAPRPRLAERHRASGSTASSSASGPARPTSAASAVG